MTGREEVQGKDNEEASMNYLPVQTLLEALHSLNSLLEIIVITGMVHPEATLSVTIITTHNFVCVCVCFTMCQGLFYNHFYRQQHHTSYTECTTQEPRRETSS